MAENRRLQCLKEASKMGFTLVEDPNGSSNKCFYQCVSKFLNMELDDVVRMVEEFMLHNQFVDSRNEVCVLL